MTLFAGHLKKLGAIACSRIGTHTIKETTKKVRTALATRRSLEITDCDDLLLNVCVRRPEDAGCAEILSGCAFAGANSVRVMRHDHRCSPKRALARSIRRLNGNRIHPSAATAESFSTNQERMLSVDSPIAFPTSFTRVSFGAAHAQNLPSGGAAVACHIYGIRECGREESALRLI